MTPAKQMFTMRAQRVVVDWLPPICRSRVRVPSGRKARSSAGRATDQTQSTLTHSLRSLSLSADASEPESQGYPVKIPPCLASRSLASASVSTAAERADADRLSLVRIQSGLPARDESGRLTGKASEKPNTFFLLSSLAFEGRESRSASVTWLKPQVSTCSEPVQVRHRSQERLPIRTTRSRDLLPSCGPELPGYRSILIPRRTHMPAPLFGPDAAALSLGDKAAAALITPDSFTSASNTHEHEGVQP